MASCRSTTRWMAISASLKVILPFISTKPQIWFAGSATATGDVSHNSRWGKVSGWRRASPLSSRCFKSARLSPDMVSARLASAQFISDRELRPQWRRRRADGRCPRRTTPRDRHPRSPRLPPEPRRPAGAGAAVLPPMWPAISDAIWPMVRARIRLVGGRATPMAASSEFSISTPISESSPRSVSG